MGCKLTSQDEGTEMLGTSGFQSASKMKCGKGGKTSHLPSSRMKTIHSLLRRRRLVMCFWIQCFICSKICPFFCQHPQDMNLSLGRVAFSLCMAETLPGAPQCMGLSPAACRGSIRACLLDCADSRPFSEAGAEVMVMWVWKRHFSPTCTVLD